MNDELKIITKNKIEMNNTFFLNNKVVEVSNDEYNSLFTDIKDDVKLLIFQKIISNIMLNDSQSKLRASNIFRYLVNREGGYSEAEVEFISYYTLYLNYCLIKYDDRGQSRFGQEDIELPELCFTTVLETPDLGSDRTLAAYSCVGNIVYVNLDSRALSFAENGDKDKLFQYLQYLSHEMVHYRQSVEAKAGILSVSSFNFILSTIIRGQDFDSEVNNYRFRDEEIEAQIASMQFVVELGKKFFPQYIEFQEKMLCRREDYMLEEALSMQQDDTNSSVLTDFYDIGALNVVIAGKSRGELESLFRKFPQLNIFFDETGHMKSEEEILNGYKIASIAGSPIAGIYERFLIYMYNWSDTINNTNLPDELLKEKINFISGQVKKELLNLSVIEKIVTDHKEKIGGGGRVWKRFHTERTVKMRKRRLQLYHEFLSSIDIGENNKLLFDIETMINSYNIIISDIQKIASIDKMLEPDNYNELTNIIK